MRAINTPFGSLWRVTCCKAGRVFLPAWPRTRHAAIHFVGDNAPAGEVTMGIRKQLTDIQFGRLPDRHGWLVKLRD